MTLYNACEIAKDCGLETIEEAVYNIILHRGQLFSYSEEQTELNELLTEAKSYDEKQSIDFILGE